MIQDWALSTLFLISRPFVWLTWSKLQPSLASSALLPWRVAIIPLRAVARPNLFVQHGKKALINSGRGTRFWFFIVLSTDLYRPSSIRKWYMKNLRQKHLSWHKVPKNHNENKRLYKRQSKTPLITLNLPQTDGVLISTTFNAWNHMRWFWAHFPQTSYTKTMTWCCEVLRIGIMVLQVLPLPGLFLPFPPTLLPFQPHATAHACCGSPVPWQVRNWPLGAIPQMHEAFFAGRWAPRSISQHPEASSWGQDAVTSTPSAGITTAHIWMSQSSLGARSIISTQILHWNSIPEIATSSAHMPFVSFGVHSLCWKPPNTIFCCRGYLWSKLSHFCATASSDFPILQPVNIWIGKKVDVSKDR